MIPYVVVKSYLSDFRRQAHAQFIYRATMTQNTTMLSLSLVEPQIFYTLSNNLFNVSLSL